MLMHWCWCTDADDGRGWFDFGHGWCYSCDECGWSGSDTQNFLGAKPLYIILLYITGSTRPTQINEAVHCTVYNVKVISTDIFGTKRATGDPRVSKRPYFLWLFGFPKKSWFFFVDFRISGFLHFFGFLSISLELRELPEIRWCQNNRNF